MDTTIIISGITKSVELVGEQDQIVVTETGQILIDEFVAPDDGIRDLESTVWHVTATVYGEVHAQWNGIFIRAVDSVITVGSTGTVSGGRNGVALNLGSRLLNDGNVTGVLAGVLASLENVTIHNTGSISGAVGVLGNQTVGDEANHTVLANFGSVSGTTHGVWFSNSSVVTNEGSIAAAGHGVLLSTLAGDVARLTNSGTITAATAVGGGVGSEIILNTGSLQGNVVLEAGDDTYDGRGGSVTGTVDLGDGADTAYGGAGDEVILGGTGADWLDGGAGADQMDGGGDDDTYVVDNVGDVIAEAANAGTDTVRASVDFTLSAEVEALILTGADDLSGTGNASANMLLGNRGANRLAGAQGSDVLDGGAGLDTAVFSGAKANYAFADNGDGSITVTDLIGQDGSDTLSNMEWAEFADGTISIAPPATPSVKGSVSPINENAPANTIVATIESSSLAGEALHYQLVDDLDGKLAIDADTGVITLIGAVDYESTTDTDLQIAGTRKFYVLEVKAVTSEGLALSSASISVTVYVNDVNEAPAELSFSNGTQTATIDGVVGNGTIVGTLMASDPDGDTQLVYSFDSTGNGNSSGAGNAGGLFKLEGGTLKFARTPSATDPESYTVTLKVTDKNGGPGATSYYKDFLINFNPGDTPPTPNVLSIAPDSATHAEGDAGLTDFTFVVTRANAAGDTEVDWEVVTGGAIEATDFDLLTGTVQFTGTETTKTVTVQVKGDLAIEGHETFTVKLKDVSGGTIKVNGGQATGTITNDDQPTFSNRAPTDIQLSGPNAAIEYAGAGTAIGTLTASDPDVGNTFSYSLLGADERFEIVGNQVLVKNGFKLDFEQVPAHQIVVRATDNSGAVFDKALTIGVIDINPEYTLGSAFDDVFKGGRSNDKLGGGLGNDILWGGLGKDTLTGGLGKDTFVFNTKLNKKTNKDAIKDFNVRDDSIWLDNAIFKKLGKKGTELTPAKLNKKFFTVGDKAQDANDYLVYNKQKGVLYYDIDGSGAKAAVEIATTKKNLKMTYKDFFVI
ncbi:Calx-beta domain-containing protein [Microvirga brassicacearum]|uniref:Cadherin domain-containing protein n=1 Tax=Microvirga brassicacearum TaxID=2580413 RepID=A0A5N3P9W0_9HYPH|nr:Calx-beta domain-containing protein [Microvirga brassicacearum]KAB0266530.1 hypothetical protein FEZ63_14325 [Microvirga brassicacearum]